MPNLLVIQYVETLYLGENNVRVVCERVKKLKLYAFKKSLVTNLRLASRHTCEVCKGAEGSQ